MVAVTNGGTCAYWSLSGGLIPEWLPEWNPKAVKYVFWGLVAALFGYEAVAIFNGIPGDTISEIIWNVAATHPIVSFLLGLLMGHFFWQRAR